MQTGLENPAIAINKKEAGTRFELADIPFAEDSLEPLGQPALFVEIKGLEPLTYTV
jgi:hypothetical protein